MTSDAIFSMMNALRIVRLAFDVVRAAFLWLLWCGDMPLRFYIRLSEL